MDIHRAAPLLVAQDASRMLYKGFLCAGGEQFLIRIKLKAPDTLEGCQIDAEWRLKHLLVDYQKIIQQRLCQSSDLSSFLVELQSLIEKKANRRQPISSIVKSAFYDRVIGELDSIGWHRLSYVDPGFQELHLEAMDSAGRSHLLKVNFHVKQENSYTYIADLPMPFHFSNASTTLCSLTSILSHFESCVESYQDFWNAMDELDGNTWILEPEKPTRSAVMRRIALGNSSSMQIDVDPLNPRSLPDCRFMGPDHIIGPLKENLQENFHCWNNKHSLLENLQEILLYSFPSPSSTNKEDFSVFCGICYAYRLEGLLPEDVCENPKCSQPFHQLCLYEWLHSLTSTRQSFSVLFGECPFCDKPINVKIPAR